MQNMNLYQLKNNNKNSSTENKALSKGFKNVDNGTSTLNLENLENVNVLENMNIVDENNDNYSNLKKNNSSYLTILNEEVSTLTKINNEGSIVKVKSDINSLLQDNSNINSDPRLIVANFPYLKNTNFDNNENILPITNATNVDSETLVNGNSALSLVNLQNNIILAYNDEFFFFEQ